MKTILTQEEEKGKNIFDKGDDSVDIWLGHEPRNTGIEADFFKMMKERGIAVRHFDVDDIVDTEIKRLLPVDIFIYKLALDL